MNYEQKHPILQKLEEYFKNTPKEQIDKDWSNILKDTDSEAYYEEKYKEALERARDVYIYYCDDREQLRKIESIFPELAESEDERVRKEIISFLKDFEKDHYRSVNFNSWIAWLEKQDKALDADKVIEWMRVKAPKWLYDMVYPIRLDVDAEDLIKQFKKDFGL